MIFSLPQTSLIPTIIEIISFINQNWPDIWWFPHWYLGVPLRFITGPVVPLITLIISKVTSLDIWVSYGILIALSGLGGIVGFQKLLKSLGAGKRIIRLSTLFYLLLPFNIFLFSFGNGLHHLTNFLLSWPLYFYLRFLETESKTDIPESQHFLAPVYIVISILILFLIDFGVVLPLVIGMCAIFVSAKRTDRTLNTLVRSVLMILCAFTISMIWYTPGYFWTVFGNPSFGGRPLSNVIPMIFKLLQALLPVVIGVWVVQKKVVLKSRLTYFALLFAASFLGLTLIRMMSDIDFWMDWSSYGLELQFASAVLLALAFSRYIKIRIVIVISIFILTITDGFLVFKLFTNTKDFGFAKEIYDITKSFHEKDTRWFLSGSPVFWISLKQNTSISQVRGGKDSVSIHPTWAMGAFQIREGKRFELTDAWLEALGVSHLLVHADNSHEYFHDFKVLEKFETYEKIAGYDTDIWYTSGFDIARFTTPEILEIDAPINGEDMSVVEYADLLEESVDVTIPTPTTISLKLDSIQKDKYIWLAHTFHKNWQVTAGDAYLKKDNFGNMILVPKEESTHWQLAYREGWGSWVVGLLLIGLTTGLYTYSKRLISVLAQKFPSLGAEQVDEQDNY